MVASSPKSLRRRWAPLPTRRRHILGCDWINDDQHPQHLLSDLVEPSSLLRHWRLARFRSSVLKCMPGLLDARSADHLSRLFWLSTWFLQKGSAALGLVAAGASLGGLIFPAMIINLLPRSGFG